MRALHLFSASTLALACGVSWFSQGAVAADPAVPALDSSYISLFGGINWGHVQADYSATQYEILLKEGFTVGAAFGRHLDNGFRAEGEFSFVAADHKKRRINNGSFDSGMNGETRSFFLLGNIWKDIRLNDTVQPYVGVGLGTALLSSEESEEINWDDASIGLAGQVGAGVRVALSNRLALDASYRLRAVIDASLHSVDGNENGVFSHYSHTAQLGLSYAFGEGGIMAPAGDPADWYVSLFSGAALTDSNFNYRNGTQYLIDHKTGFTIGGAVGTHLAPGLRTELELSYLRSGLDSFGTDGDQNDPADGALEQGYLLANIWKDFDLGMVTPYVGGGIGFGLIRFDDATFDDGSSSNPSSDTGYGFAAQVGAGTRMGLTDNVSIDLGYRFKGIVDALIIGGNDKIGNSELAATNHVFQLGLNYGLGAAGDDTGVLPDTSYVSLFGGTVLPRDTHHNIDFSDHMVDFKTGFTVGAALGANVSENMRGEVEVSYQQFDVKSVDQLGFPAPDPSGDVNGFFLLTNLWRDYDLGAFHPYAGGGVGVGFMDVNIDYGNNNSITDDSALGLAAQVGSGLRFDMTDNLALDLGYRFKTTLAIGTEGFEGDDNNSSTYYTHVGQLGVSWKF